MRENSQPTRRHRARRVAKVAAPVALLAFGAAMIFLDGWGQDDRAAPADAIIVLGAHVLVNGKAGAALRSRAEHGAALYRKGLARHIITTGGVGDNPPAESQVAAVICEKLGVPRAAIFQDDTSTSTHENAVNAAAICQAHGWKKVIVVSEPFHLWRACRDFRKAGLEPLPSPAPNRSFLLRLRMTAREVPVALRNVLIGR